MRRSRLFSLGMMWLLVTASVGAISLVSVQQEVEIGQQANAQVRREVPEMRDAEVTAYIGTLGRQLAQYAPGPRYPYSFSVADYREINAFALPGGPVWIHRGIIHAAANESQLASVLAHEIGHIAERHAADQLTKAMIANWGIGILGAVLGNSGGASAAQVAARLIGNGMFLKFSRDDEREADRVGLQIMTRAGWDGRGMLELFDVLRAEAKRDPGNVETFFSTHPSPQDRIDRLRADVAGRSGGRRNSQQFQAIKARARRLPPPRSMPRQ